MTVITSSALRSGVSIGSNFSFTEPLLVA